jgi:dsRNA-specific ribonuclease
MALLFAPVEDKLDYKFVNPSLVVEAFTHTAYDLTKGPSYNRLEYLGDCMCLLRVVYFVR